MIVERTQEGKAIAKQRADFREGRPKKFNKKQIQHALGLLDKHSYTQVEKMTGISKKYINTSKKEKRVGRIIPAFSFWSQKIQSRGGQF